jgi:hypothetical protein
MAAQDFSGRTMADAETNIGSCGLASVLSTSNPCPSMPTVMLVPSALGVTGDAGGTPRRIAAGQKGSKTRARPSAWALALQ